MRRGGSLPILLLVPAFPAGAEAHTTVPGMNHFINGIFHPLMTPPHLLILLGLGVALGQHVPFKAGLLARVFAPLAALALALTATGWIPGVKPAVLVVIALGAGAAVAFGKPPPPFASGALFAAGALAIGLDSGVETGGTATVVTTLLGTWIGLLLILFNIAYCASRAAEQKKKWMDIGLRVAGSWIAAISLLLLAFSLRR